MVHRSHDELCAELQDLVVRAGQRYQHYKTHGIYIVDCLAFLEATDTPAVIYYDPEHPELKWIRPYDDFTAQVDGQARFRLLDA